MKYKKMPEPINLIKHMNQKILSLRLEVHGTIVDSIQLTFESILEYYSDALMETYEDEKEEPNY